MDPATTVKTERQNDTMSNEIIALKLEPSDNLPLSRRARDVGRLHKPEPRSNRRTGLARAGRAVITRHEASRRRQRTSRTRGGKYGAVEDVYELGPNREVHLLAEPERAPHGEVLHGMPLGPVITVIRR